MTPSAVAVPELRRISEAQMFSIPVWTYFVMNKLFVRLSNRKTCIARHSATEACKQSTPSGIEVKVVSRSSPNRCCNRVKLRCCVHVASTASETFYLIEESKRAGEGQCRRIAGHSASFAPKICPKSFTPGHTRPQVPRSARLCPHCSSQSVGDEKHLVFECPFLQQVRSKYPSLFDLPLQSMHLFFSQKDRMHVFRFILDCLDMIET